MPCARSCFEANDGARIDERHWILRRVAFGFPDIGQFPELSADDWSTLDDHLSQSTHLRSVELYCGNGALEEGFNELVESVRSQLATVGGKVQGWYSSKIPDGREMALELFGTGWRDMELMQILQTVSTPGD